MRMDKGAILASMAIIMLASVFAGAGTMAYFSDVETSKGNQFSAGTLNIKIWDGSGYTESAVTGVLSLGPMQPGETYLTERIYIKNVGDISARYMHVSFRDPVYGEGKDPDHEPAGSPYYLAKQIQLLTVIDRSPNNYGIGSIAYTVFDAAISDIWEDAWGVPDKDSKISLYEILTYGDVGGSTVGAWARIHTGDDYHLDYPYLPVGAEVWIQFEFKLMEDTDNRAQGDYVKFDALFFATNTLNLADAN